MAARDAVNVRLRPSPYSEDGNILVVNRSNGVCALSLCISSVMSGGLNDAGRGLNFVVVNPDTKEVVRVARFDTFSSGLTSDSFQHSSLGWAIVWCCLSDPMFGRIPAYYGRTDR